MGSVVLVYPRKNAKKVIHPHGKRVRFLALR